MSANSSLPLATTTRPSARTARRQLVPPRGSGHTLHVGKLLDSCFLSTTMQLEGCSLIRSLALRTAFVLVVSLRPGWVYISLWDLFSFCRFVYVFWHSTFSRLFIVVKHLMFWLRAAENNIKVLLTRLKGIWIHSEQAKRFECGIGSLKNYPAFEKVQNIMIIF